jgi:hypothetical protein
LFDIFKWLAAFLRRKLPVLFIWQLKNARLRPAFGREIWLSSSEAVISYLNSSSVGIFRVK